jgi:hypothetical protein
LNALFFKSPAGRGRRVSKELTPSIFAKTLGSLPEDAGTDAAEERVVIRPGSTSSGVRKRSTVGADGGDLEDFALDEELAGDVLAELDAPLELGSNADLPDANSASLELRRPLTTDGDRRFPTRRSCFEARNSNAQKSSGINVPATDPCIPSVPCEPPRGASATSRAGGAARGQLLQKMTISAATRSRLFREDLEVLFTPVAPASHTRRRSKSLASGNAAAAA